MKIENIKIYDLSECLQAAGYPMQTEINYDKEFSDKDVTRGAKLVSATLTGNTAHNQFETGIRVNFDLTCSNKMWVEAERYRFLEFVSSQSTMHRITKFDISNQYNTYVDDRIISIMKDKINKYNKTSEIIKASENKTDLSDEYKQSLKDDLKLQYLEILYSNPAGFELTARMTTNYRCLRNIYIQRHDHRLPEWRSFCKWIESLPYADDLILKGLDYRVEC